MIADAKPVLVIGGGIAGMTAAVEAAEYGARVVIVEKEAFLGGRVVRMHRYFPKMCPPTCGFEINVRRIRQNPRITVHTLATVESISGSAGDFRASVKIKPRHVTGVRTIDASVAATLAKNRPNDFNYGMDKTGALYMPQGMAWPHLHALDLDALSDDDARGLVEASPPGSIDLEMKERTIAVDAGAVIVATGWRPYDAVLLDNLGFGQFGNVITNVMMERLADGDGPTGGEIVRPSDGKKAENVAFVQCAGSRDTNHLPYCSAVCCMASLKQVRFLREKNENARATVFYIDIRTVGRHEKFYHDMLDDPNINFVKGKVARITEDEAGGNVSLDVEDTLERNNLHESFDMAVLATGIVPVVPEFDMPVELQRDEYGFIDGTTNVEGIYAAGCVKRPLEVSRTTKDATGAALKAIQCLNGGG